MLRYLFADMNSFFASCEQQDRGLTGPLAVVPMANVDTTCVIAASYEAKAYGVGTGTAVHEAKKLCPSIKLIEARPELAALCNRVARENNFPHLTFTAGTIADATLEPPDILIALHACDTATDDALARGLSSDARLLVVAPCCQKELRPQLTAPPVLADALRHGIFQERQSEFVTDALRAQLLEWAGYRTKVFEFISTEHTAKNLMIAAIRSHPPGDDARAARVREFAVFYGIRTQRLAAHLGLALSP